MLKPVSGFIISTSLFTLLIGCGLAPQKTAIDHKYRVEDVSDPLNTELEVFTGERIAATGKVAINEGFVISSEISSMMPGAYGIPFKFSINPTTLTKRYRRGKFEYFCAPLKSASATFPGLGQVYRQGDCIGIRRSSSKLEWVVDNSEYNGHTTVWSRPYRPKKDPVITPSEGAIETQDSYATVITFDGYFSDLLHFTLIELEKGKRNETAFKFDYPPKNGAPTYGIKGNVFEVVSVDNTRLVYIWNRVQ